MEEQQLFLIHYGTPRHSGRYPWGSGESNKNTNFRNREKNKIEKNMNYQQKKFDKYKNSSQYKKDDKKTYKKTITNNYRKLVSEESINNIMNMSEKQISQQKLARGARIASGVLLMSFAIPAALICPPIAAMDIAMGIGAIKYAHKTSDTLTTEKHVELYKKAVKQANKLRPKDYKEDSKYNQAKEIARLINTNKTYRAGVVYAINPESFYGIMANMSDTDKMYFINQIYT